MDRFSNRSAKSMPRRTEESVKYGPKRGVEKTSLKAGDEERIRIMNMVKAGEISIDNAVEEAEGLGVAPVPQSSFDEQDENSNGKIEDEVYNFGVHKLGKNNKSVKCVLQLDFPEHTMYFIQRGQRNKKYDFSSVKTAESEDGTTRVFLSMDDTTEYELDANSFADRNRIVRLLNYIIEQQGCEDSGQYKSNRQTMLRGVIKEGILEKKGHNAAILVWAKRFVRIRNGEMLYFKVGDEVSNDNALNVVQLGHDAAFLRKLDSNGFIVITNKREYHFRMPTSSSQTPSTMEKARDDWIIAIQEASRPARFNSIASRYEKAKDPTAVANEQERFLKSAVGTLKEELEQLNTILTIVDAPFKASIQVRRVREIVQKLDEQVKTGLLSFTMRSMVQQHKRQTRTEESNTYNTLNFSQDSQGGYEEASANASTVTKRIDFASSRNAILGASGQRQTSTGKAKQADSFESQSSGTHAKYGTPMSSNAYEDASEKPLQRPANLYQDASETSRKSEVRKSDLYAKVNKSGKHKASSCDSVESDDDQYDDDHPPPLPPRTLSTPSKDESGKQHSVETNKPKTGESASDEVTKLQPPPSTSSSSLSAEISNKEQEVPEKSKEPPSAPVPPPPPPVNGNIPPPPPPPPMIGVPGGPPPPPLPGMMSNMLLPHKKAINPNKKMKPLFWMKVPDMIVANSFWSGAKEREEIFDFNLLEDLFQAENKKSAPTSVTNTAANPNKTLLDSKKAQNLGIFLSGFKMKPEEIESKLMVFNEEEGLMLEQIVALKRFQPNTDEIELYKNFNGKSDELPLVDKFMLKLCDIPNLNRKLDILLTIMEVPSQCEDIRPPIILLLDACVSLKKSSTFERLLEYILALGNYVNGGTTRGVAYGFKLSSLVKLANVYSSNKEYNLLRFLVEQIFDEDPKALRCFEEMPALLKPMDASIKGLSAEIDVMKTDLKKAQISIEAALKGVQNEHEKLFLGKASEFIASYSSDIEEMSAKCKEIQQVSVALLKKFGESPTASFETWLRDVAEFLQQLKKAVDNEDQRRKRRSRRAASVTDEDPMATIGDPSSPKEPGKNMDKFQPVLAELAENSASQSKRTKGHYDEGFIFKPKPNTPNKTPLNPQIDKSNRSSTYPPKHSDYQHNRIFDNQSQDFDPYKHTALPRAYELKQAEIVHSQSLENINEPTPGHAVSTGLPAPPIKHGFLEKLSGGKKRAQKWDKRYFEITASGYLYYYKKVQGKPAGTIYLRGCPVQQDFEDPKIVCIESEDRDWKLRAESAAEAKQWVDTLMMFVRKM